MTFETLVILGFAAVPFIEFSGYIPKLIETHNHKGPIKNFSYRMWSIWLMSGLISLVYGVFHLQDFLFTVCVMFNLAPVAAILGYALYKEDKAKIARGLSRFLNVQNSVTLQAAGFFKNSDYPYNSGLGFEPMTLSPQNQFADQPSRRQYRGSNASRGISAQRYTTYPIQPDNRG